MRIRAAIFVVALAVQLMMLSVAIVFAYRHGRRQVSRVDNWERLLAQLIAVQSGNIVIIATDLHEELQSAASAGKPENFDPSGIWAMIGGLGGLEDLSANCDVIIDLACYLQRIAPEALVVAEELRLNARELRWHLDRLKAAQKIGTLERAFPDNAQRAIATYYDMTRKLLTLYEFNTIEGYMQLRAVL